MWRSRIALGVLVNVASAQSPHRSGVVAFVGVHVLPIEPSGALLDRSVVVRDGLVERIELAHGFVVPEGALVIEGRGRWLLPGLVDAHARLEDTGELALHLARGVTTVRVQPGRTAVLDLRDRIERGELIGPRLVVDGPRIDRGEPERMREIVAALARAGFDGLTVGRRLPAESALELVDCAIEHGLPVGGELPRALDRERGLVGRATLAGAEFLMDPPIPPPSDGKPEVQRPFYVERGMGRPLAPDVLRATSTRVAHAGVVVVPLLAAFEGLFPQIEHRPEMLLDSELTRISPPFRLLWGFHGHGLRRFFPTPSIEPARECFAFQRRLLVALHDSGARLAAGSFAMQDFVWPGEGLVVELEAWCAAGLTANDALRGATIDAARALGLDVGVVRVGLRADLVLVERDPREDIGRLRGVVGVMVRGRWLDAAEIEAERRSRAAPYPREDEDVNGLVPKDVRVALDAIAARGGGLLARPEAALRLGELLVDVDRAKDAELFARCAIQAHPEAWWPHWVLARALRRLEETAGAIAAARRALELRPDAIEPWLLLEELGAHADRPR